MKAQEIFSKLQDLRTKIEGDTEEPMLSSDNALLYDVALALGLSEEQAATLAGDDLTITTQDEPQSEPHDFDTGFGIGGLGRHQERPTIPTVGQMKRMEQLTASAITCRRCRQTDVIDGAMFTTGGGDVCDDCF